MSWFDSIMGGRHDVDVRDTLRLSVEEFEGIPVKKHDDPEGDQIGDQWRIKRHRMTTVNGFDQYDNGWDYFTVLGFTDSNRLVTYSMRLEAWKDGRRVK